MLDTKLLRDDPEGTIKRLSTRGQKAFEGMVDLLKNLEDRRKKLQTEIQDLQHKRNQLSKEIGFAKGKGLEAQTLLKETEGLSEQLKEQEKAFESVHQELQALYDQIPNLPHESVPLGSSEENNVEVRRVGTPPVFSFTPKDHVALTEGLMDFEASAKISGSRFVVLYGAIAKLHRALAQFMLDIHTKEHHYQEVYVPYLVTSNSLYGTGQFPKFKGDQFKIEEEDLWLIPTSEVAVTNLHREEIIESFDRLPLRYVCYSPCFRKEAGTYGKDMRGMLRQHQFDKVEMVQLTHPDKSYDTLEEMVGHAETILKRLKLAYRVVSLCTGDLGFQSSKTYDLEVWLPGQDRYREISSCSNTESFQARRMQARFRNPTTKKPEFLHTLNGSGLAVGRTLIAVLENYQDADGNIQIPEALVPYMGGEKVIRVR